MTPDACNICGGDLRTSYPRVLDPQSRETFAIARCERCGLGHTTPQPDDLGRYYGPAYHGGRHGFTARYCAHRRMQFVRSAAGSAPGTRMLDIGCGDGTFLLDCRDAGFRVAGTEMSPTIARAAGLTVYDTIEEATESGPYDCITLWHSLEHMRDPKAVIAAAARLLAPASSGKPGTLLVAVPNAAGWQAKVFGRRWFHLDVPRHLFHFGDRSLTELLEGAGLGVVARWDQELELDVFGWIQSTLNSVLPNPNVFFYELTGRPSGGSRRELLASYALGAMVGALTLPAVPAAALAEKGGTLVFAARRAAAA